MQDVLLNFSYTSLLTCHVCSDNKNQCTQTDITSVSVQSTPFSRPSRRGVLLLCKLAVQVQHIKQALLTIIFVAWSSTRNSLHRPSNAPRGPWSLCPEARGSEITHSSPGPWRISGLSVSALRAASRQGGALDPVFRSNCGQVEVIKPFDRAAERDSQIAPPEASTISTPSWKSCNELIPSPNC